MDKHLIVAIVLIVVARIDTARILAVYPTPSISHQFVYRQLTHELIKRGHEVVVITTDPAYPPGKAPKNLTEIDVHDISYESWRNGIIAGDVGITNDINKQMNAIINVSGIYFESQLKTKPIQDIIENKNNVTFDLLLLETCARAALAFSHIYKAPVISVNSHGAIFGFYERLGVPSHPLLYPVSPRQRLYNLRYWEKPKEIYNHYVLENIYDSFELVEHEMLKKYFGPDLPILSKLYNNIDMFIQNAHCILVDNPPVPPNIIYMGGLHQKSPKELPEDLNLYLNSSKNGVIYVSFGTNVKTSFLLPDKVQMMIKVFSSLPYDVLWKMDTEELSGISNNIKISKWLPQADLLRHPKIKAFITQGGLQSTDEAVNAGVPLIGVPIFGDQWFNVEKYIRNEIGTYVDWESITEEEFKAAILTVTEDERYRKNIRRLNSLLNDQPQSSMERAIWWMEYVLRHGGSKHLRGPAANMSWAEYYELELVVILLIGLFVTLYFLFLVFKFVWISLLRIFKRLKVKNS